MNEGEDIYVTEDLKLIELHIVGFSISGEDTNLYLEWANRCQLHYILLDEGTNRQIMINKIERLVK